MEAHIITRLKDTYRRLGYENLALLGDVYAEDVLFIDPFHRLEGLKELTRHFENMYQNLFSIHFDYQDELTEKDRSFLTWRMDFSHRAIKKGEIISVTGASLLKFDRKIVFHRDYFDASAMIFDHLPVIGHILKQIRKRV
ncbi:nuclear transport factor 2 family protein [bacterium]|nr:nuclear transport factor 2 family protein [bacterium]